MVAGNLVFEVIYTVEQRTFLSLYAQAQTVVLLTQLVVGALLGFE